MTYTVNRDGVVLGTYSEDGLSRQLTNGIVLPTDLVFLEKEQRWVPVADLPKGEAEEIAEFTQKLETAGPPVFVTPALIAINLVVFLAMVISGVSILTPASLDLIRWGGDFGPLVAHGEWWRLITSAFVHAGFLHIGLNMWVLFSGGRYTERLLGNVAFLVLYLLSAIGGSLSSIAWHPATVSVGASGAIFGVYGGLIGLLMLRQKSIPPAAAASLSKNAIGFVSYNILFGVTGSFNIDMAAHLGGLITGLIVGCALGYRVDAMAEGIRLRRSGVVMLITVGLFVPIGWKLCARDAKQADVYAAELHGKTLIVGKTDRIVYSGMATEADAKSLGQTLTRIGLMRDRGIMILYTKDHAESVVSLIVKDDASQKPAVVSSFNLFGLLISGTTGTPMKFRLFNTKRKLEKEFVFDKNVPRLPRLAPHK